ncbi:keratin-associated protein 10-7-like [Patagioenas fasciata monilis]|uniref:Keratin-associated protein 10-7-like n=1 Tax=Patagioenas fasciata monilis TaxID=372326 RepID=A0A1V4KKQ7_PATFA|nr:keratin-associated protein 10-7-like [Patagioenas fasciata monilis]
MPTARSVLVLAGLLALWAELPPASAQNVTTKAGVCPDPAMEAVNCTVGCQSDGDCESTLKCCPAACGKACQKPDEKPGTCPPEWLRQGLLRDTPPLRHPRLLPARPQGSCCVTRLLLGTAATWKGCTCQIPVLTVCTMSLRDPRQCPCPESPGYCPRASSPARTSCRMSCRNDTMCSPGQKCCTRGCCARCTPAQPAKPGFCPRKRARSSAATCSNRCADDRDCPGNRKCCFSGCGLACARPNTGGHNAAAKPGVCPVVLRGSLGPCLELCDTDSNCTGPDKCCTTGCGHICKPPIEVRPGLCPPMTDDDPAAECLLLCSQDKDCPPSQKCCLRGCGRACVPLLRDMA